jgi:hypothetical protein
LFSQLCSGNQQSLYAPICTYMHLYAHMKVARLGMKVARLGMKVARLGI